MRTACKATGANTETSISSRGMGWRVLPDCDAGVSAAAVAVSTNTARVAMTRNIRGLKRVNVSSNKHEMLDTFTLCRLP